MGIEIERKFKVDEKVIRQVITREATQSIEIRQGYLAFSLDAMVRVRTWDDQGFLTIKSGTKSDNPLICHEYEYEIPYFEALELLDICASSLHKVRHIILTGPNNDRWEVDQFYGKLKGLYLAEFEHVDLERVENVAIPSWLTEEVTGDKLYSNFSLSLKSD